MIVYPDTSFLCAVYRAQDTLAGREVAVKVIPTALASGAGIEPRAGEDEDTQFDRFRLEFDLPPADT